MKTLIFTGSLFLLTAASLLADDSTVNLFVGQLLTAGSQTLPDGALIQIIVDTDAGSSNFAVPTATSFLGGASDEIIAASFGLDSTTAGVPGDFVNAASFDLSGPVAAGDSILIRWWPTLTTSDSEPGSGSAYGQFRTDVAGVDVSDPDASWVIPSAGSTEDLSFLTQSQGGSEADSQGVAANTVGAAVPEPGSMGLLSLAAASLLAWRRNRRGGRLALIVLALPASQFLAPAQVSAAALPSLVDEYKFDASGADAGSAGENLTLGSASSIDTSNFIIGGGSLNLDGSINSYAETSSAYAPVLGSSARTISLWLDTGVTTTDSNSNNETLISWGKTGSTNGARNDLRLSNVTASGADLRFEIQNSFLETSALPLDNGEWHNVVFSYAGGSNTPQLYVDGSLIPWATGTLSTVNTVASSPLQIGNSGQDSSRHFDGNIDDVGIFSGALSQTHAQLIEALGLIAGDGLDDLSAANNLWTNGGSTNIGGVTWSKVSGLSGSEGTVGSNYVVLDNAGDGLVAAVPEPSSGALAGIAMLGLLGSGFRSRFRLQQ